eukprot:gene33176-42904_t
MSAIISCYFSKSLPVGAEIPAWSKKHTPASSISEDILIDQVQKIQKNEYKASPVLHSESEFELDIKKRFSPPSEINALPENELLRRFNAQAPKIIYPLNIAVMENNIAMVQELLSKGAFLDVLDQTGKSPLANAFELGNTSIADILIAAKDAEFQNSPHSPYAPSCDENEANHCYEENDFFYYPNSSALNIHQQDPEQSTVSNDHHYHYHHYHHHHHHHDRINSNCAIEEGVDKVTSSLPVISTVLASSISQSSPVAATAIPILLQPKKKSYTSRLKKATRRMFAYVQGKVPE